MKGGWRSCPSVTYITCPGAPGPTLTSGAVAGTGVPELDLSPHSCLILVLSAPELLYQEASSVWVGTALYVVQGTVLQVKAHQQGWELVEKAHRACTSG